MALEATRRLGGTGVMVPPIGYGTAPLGKPNITQDHAVLCLQTAVDAGITYLDTSPDYGSEPHVGAFLAERRQDVFVATKVNRRERLTALDELQHSLERLKTDHVDLVQIHAVNTYADLEAVFAPGGVIHGLEMARERGLTRFIGITGHARPDVLANALRRYNFDTVLCALGVVDHLVSGPEQSLLPVAAEKNTGVVAMKALAHGKLADRDRALRYSLGIPGVSLAIVGLGTPGQVTEAVELAERLRPLSDDDRAALIAEARTLIERDKDDGSLFWLHDTSVMAWHTGPEPAGVVY